MKNLYRLIIVLTLLIFYSCGTMTYVTPNNGKSVIEESKTNGVNERIVVFKVTGKGMAPESALRRGEAIILGERSAVLDGYRQLLEKLKGALVDTYSKRDGTIIDMDVITSEAQSYLKGVKILDTKKDEYDVFSVDMQVRVFFTNNELIWWPSGLGPNITPYSSTVYYATSVASQTIRCESYPWCGQYYYYGGGH